MKVIYQNKEIELEEATIDQMSLDYLNPDSLNEKKEEKNDE